MMNFWHENPWKRLPDITELSPLIAAAIESCYGKNLRSDVCAAFI